MAEADVKLPSWVVLGRKLRWYSQSQKKHVGVKCTYIDEKKRALIVSFDADKSATKIVPFSQLGRPECPLSDDPSNAVKQKRKEPATVPGSSSKDPEDGAATPDWWAQEKTKILDRSGASNVEKTVDEQLRKAAKEEEKRQEERRKQAAIEADKKKVEEAFERRKREAELRRLKEEEDWRNSLKKRRLEEEALDREKNREKEARRLKRAEEKAEKARREGKPLPPAGNPARMVQATDAQQQKLSPAAALRQVTEAQLAAIQASNVAAWGLLGAAASPMPGMPAPLPFGPGAPLPPGAGPPLPPGAGPPLPTQVLATHVGMQAVPLAPQPPPPAPRPQLDLRQVAEASAASTGDWASQLLQVLGTTEGAHQFPG